MALEVEASANIFMVEPALAYLDFIRKTDDRCEVPIAAYWASGKCSQSVPAARLGCIDGERMINAPERARS